MTSATDNSLAAASVNATAEEARAVAEAARETEWNRPSFAKGLYLGSFDLSLIHPWPQAQTGDVERGEEFMARLLAFAKTMSGRVIERDAKIPDEYLKGLADLGVFGMKIPRDYGGLGLSLVYYGRALALLGSVHPSLGAPHFRPPVHRRSGARQGVRHARAKAGIPAALRRRRHHRVPPDRARRRQRPRAHGRHCRTVRRRRFLPFGRRETLDHQRCDRRARGGHGQGPFAHTDADGTEHKGGISAFVVEMDSPGITVENRNAFMGLRGIENGVTRFHQVRVPAANRLGREGQGLKIALTTLNTGRLSIPGLCVAAGKWSLKISREWSNARTQWGRPVGQHEAVGKKIAFIAATTFALEAVFELSAEMADAGQKDVRIEAALAKLWSTELSCRIADELVQIRGGRGFETADSLEARGERAVPAEQLLRDLRINRIFEGSSEIMKLLIAREAVDAHLAAAGDLASADASLQDKARAAVGASGFYATLVAQTGGGCRDGSAVLRGVRPFGQAIAVCGDAPRGGLPGRRSMAWAVGRPSWSTSRRSWAGSWTLALSCSPWRHAALGPKCCSANTPNRGPPRSNWPKRSASRRACGWTNTFDQLWRNTDDGDHHLSRKVLAGDYAWLEAGVLDQSEGTGPWIGDASPGASTKENLHRKYR
jgi:alkylation response protein AidB-like acyl-CoA dehydrogenase